MLHVRHHHESSRHRLRCPSTNARGPRRQRVGACLSLVTLMVAVTFTSQRAFAEKPKQEAAALSVVAGAKAKAGDYKLCAEMYQQCYRLDPSFLGYLYSAARCAQKGGQLDLAEKHYREFISRSPAEHLLRPRADVHMKELMQARRVAAEKQALAEKVAAEKAAAEKAKAVAPKPTMVSKPIVTARNGDAGVRKPASVMSGRALRGWIGVGGGVVMAGVAGWLAWRAKSDFDDLKVAITMPSGTSLIDSITHAEAVERNDAIRSGTTMAAITGGLALAAAGAGAYLLLTDAAPAKSALRISPIPGHLSAAWELRW